MIKYLGSKRRLVPLLGAIAARVGGRTALDAFTGTTRVAQEFKRQGLEVTALDSARYAHAFARCYIETDACVVDRAALARTLAELAALPGRDGYVTETFCRNARYLTPENGARIDAIRDALQERRDDPLFPLLLTSLIEAADRVDSTAGVQMAYLKSWAPRALKELELRVPELLEGPGRALHGDALTLLPTLPEVDLAYLDPPYNQHSYMGNYHVWETVTAWDAPEHYGVACKRTECRDPQARSAFNSRRAIAEAVSAAVRGVRARVVLLSYNDEAWLTLEELTALARERGAIEVLAFDSRRYVGARIGIHDLQGRRVGRVGRLRNVEYVIACGDREGVAAAASGVTEAHRLAAAA